MKENNFTQNQQEMFEKSSEKSQTWKKSVLTGLGLVGAAGVGAATAFVVNPDSDTEEVVSDHEDRIEGLETGVDELGQNMSEELDKLNADVDKLEQAQAAPKAAPAPKPAPEPEPQPEVERASLPEYLIVDREIVTDEHGSQQEVAYGFTENGHNCALVDDDMDGMAEIFMEDKNDTGFFAGSEVVNLEENDINVSMDHLPEFVYEPEPEVIIVEPAIEGQEVVTVDDVQEELQPDYTNDADLAANDDSIMANDIAPVDEFMA